MKQSLSEFLRSRTIFAHCILRVDIRGVSESDVILTVFAPGDDEHEGCYRIHCIHTIDYNIRPRHPATIIGGPPVKWSDSDPCLLSPDLQYIPGGDGEYFNPPIRWQLMKFGPTYVISERFQIEPEIGTAMEQVSLPS